MKDTEDIDPSDSKKLETYQAGRDRAVMDYMAGFIQPHLDQYGDVFFTDKRARTDAIERKPKFMALTLSEAASLVDLSLSKETFPGYYDTLVRLLKAEALKYSITEASRRETVSARSLLFDGNIYALSDRHSELLRITPEGWSYVREDEVPDGIFFRRTGGTTTRANDTQPRSGLDPLWEVTAIPNEFKPVVLAFAIQAMMPGTSCAGLIFEGPKGTAKTSSAIKVLSLVDPVQRLAHPKDTEEMIAQAKTRQVVTHDNISCVKGPESDWICSLITGVEDIRRKLYTDNDLNRCVLQAPVLITTLGTKNINPDLSDRVVTIPFDTMTTERKSEGDIKEFWDPVYPDVLASFYDLVSQVLRLRPTISRQDLPRMADFTLTLRTVDKILGTNSERLVKRDHAITMIEKAQESIIYKWLMSKYTDGPWTETVLLSEFVSGMQAWTFTSFLSPQELRYLPTQPKTITALINTHTEGLNLLGLTFERVRNRKGWALVIVHKPESTQETQGEGT